MTTLVVGASGATGHLLVNELRSRGEGVKAIVRSPDKFAALVDDGSQVLVVRASLLDLSEAELARHVRDCQALASCLGHTPTLRGIYGQPRQLVTEATQRLCRAIRANQAEGPTKFILMNTAGNRNRDLDEPISFGERIAVGLLRLLLPPHVDNEQAADFLRSQVGRNDPAVEWAVVRPDDLIDEARVSDYEVVPSPTRSALFDAGQTSRMNVAHFMARLITEEDTWSSWKGQMPVIYNQAVS